MISPVLVSANDFDYGQNILIRLEHLEFIYFMYITSMQVWIHGGGFVLGTSGQYIGTNFVVVGDVILVTINYRLSALGFLTTGDDRLKGTSSIR